MDTIILQIVKWFIERQLVKYGESIDWAKVKVDLQTRVQQLIPNSVFDETAAYIVGVFVDIVSSYFVQNKVAPSLAVAPAAISFAQTAINRELAVRAMKKP